ncbi:hypothetical protein R0K30_23270, partial [Bacillus sp. SIMBA_154]|uniref:hypothetical protein n=1 Tax=Bacillus sp. SIMBA_154 TaxID=3080859 RepID=UPI00397DBFFE
GDWIIIDGDDKSVAADNFCHEVLHAMQASLVSSRKSNPNAKKSQSKKKKSQSNAEKKPFKPVKIPKKLTDIDDSKISKS